MIGKEADAKASGMIRALTVLALATGAAPLGGCAVVAVADAGVTAVAVTAKTGVKVAGAGVGLAADGVGVVGRTVTGGRRDR